ncbi:uncharacterized protein LOC135207900 [Macrobrachium nipponense]|uniref:uncharacterized protein LOC135207900 n=1 Tax=Macrobrachium nipponense TaxID=159736 RepID=UPI0030C7DA39
MKKLMEWLWIAVVWATLLWPALDAAPQEAVSYEKNGVADLEIQSKKISLDPEPDYEVHVHPYPEDLLTTYKNPFENVTKSDVLKYADGLFHFVKVVDQDKIYATDVLDDSWKGWLGYFKKFFPLKNLFTFKEANEIENPIEDAPVSIWDQLLFQLLRRLFVTQAQDGGGGGTVDCEQQTESPTLEPQYTSIKFDPIGQFANGILHALKYYTGYESIYDWFNIIGEEFQNYTAFTEEITDKNQVAQNIVDAALQSGGIVAFPLPDVVLNIARYDPIALGINALVFVGFHLFFWGVFVPVSAYGSFFADENNPEDVTTTISPPEMEEENGEEEEGGGEGEQEAGEEDMAGDEGDGAEEMAGDEGDDQSANGMELADDLQPPPMEPADDMQPPSMELEDDMQRPSMELADDMQRPSMELEDDMQRPSMELEDGMQRPSIELADDLLPPPMEPADSLQQANTGQQGQQDNFGQQGQQNEFRQQGQPANNVQQGQEVNFGQQQGQQTNLGQQGQQANFGQQGQPFNFGQQDQQGNLGQQGQQFNFGQQDQQGIFGQQVQQTSFGQQSQLPSDLPNVGQGDENNRREDPYRYHHYYNNDYSNYYHRNYRNRYQIVPRPYAYYHGNYNNRRGSLY